MFRRRARLIRASPAADAGAKHTPPFVQARGACVPWLLRAPAPECVPGRAAIRCPIASQPKTRFMESPQETFRDACENAAGLLSWAKQPLALLGQLKYGKVLQALADINGFTAKQRQDKSEEMKLDRIIVIGDESAGKSSTLERIAMAAVLPRDTGICTRMPIILQLRHNPALESCDIFVTLPGEERVHAKGGEEEARQIVEEKMQQIKTQGLGIVSDQELIVEVHSRGVPTLDLVDLPGLVAVRDGDGTEPSNIAEQTISCTQKYLDDPTTGAVVCVIPANIDNLRTNRALQLVLKTDQTARKLQQYTIGVFAKADKAIDPCWDDERRSGPYWKLEQRLRGTADDSIRCVAQTLPFTVFNHASPW